jgi:site-specific DNA-methyltransferase (adenine-specific)
MKASFPVESPNLTKIAPSAPMKSWNQNRRPRRFIPKTPWFAVFPNARFAELFEQVYRVLKRDTHFYLMCDQETAFIAKPIAESAGFKFWKPLVWNKITIGMGYHYRARYEFVMFFEKGKRKLANLGISDILDVPRERGGYPAEKPAALSKILLEQSTELGALVVDPFMGSGSTGVAALELGRRFLGTDIAESSHACARERLVRMGGRDGELVPPVTPSLATPDQMRLALGQ